jgi:hypothetical protein
VEFAVGQDVLLSTANIKLKGPGSPKLMPKWIGPFKVVKRIGETAYELELPQNMLLHDVFHASLLKPYRSDGRVQPPPPELMVDGQVEYEVDMLLDCRMRKVGSGKKARTKKEYLVKWRGYGHEHNTWEPEGNLSNCPEKVKAYEEFAQGQRTAAPDNAPPRQGEPSEAAPSASAQRARKCKRRSTTK